MQYREHNESPMHLAVIERARRFNSPASSPAPQGSTQLDSQVSALGDHFQQLRMNEGANKMAGKQSYDFDGVRGYCNVCDLELTSHAHARQHLNGEKHKKKERQFVQGTLGGNLSCALCQVPFSGQENAQQHMASERHKRREAELARGTVPITTGLPVDLTARVATPAMAQVSPPPPASWLVQPGTPATPEQPRMQPEPAMEYSFDGNRGHCLVCRIELTSPEHAKQHLAGRPHKKKAGMKKTATQIASYPLYCQVCRVQMPDQAAAQSHYASENHRQHEGQLQQMLVFPARPQPTPRESEDTEKKMKWYAEEAASSGKQRPLHEMLSKSSANSEKSAPSPAHPVTAAGLQDTPQPFSTAATATASADAKTSLICRPFEATMSSTPSSFAEIIPASQPPVAPDPAHSSLSFSSLRETHDSDDETLEFMDKPSFADKQPQVTPDFLDTTSQSPTVNPTTSSLSSESGAPCDQSADADQTSVMKAHSPDNGQTAVTEGSSAIEMPRTALSDHKGPYEINSTEGLVCYACDGLRIHDLETILRHLDESSHLRRTSEWNRKTLLSSENWLRSSPPPVMKTKADPSQTAYNSPLPQTVSTANDPNSNISGTSQVLVTEKSPVTETSKTTQVNHAVPLEFTQDGALVCYACGGEKINGREAIAQHLGGNANHEERMKKWIGSKLSQPDNQRRSSPPPAMEMKAGPSMTAYNSHLPQSVSTADDPNCNISSSNSTLSGSSPEKPTGSPGQNSSDVQQKMWTALKEGQLTTEPRPPQQTDREAAPTGNPGSSSSSPAHSRIAGVDTCQSASTTATTQPSTDANVILSASQPPVTSDPAHSSPRYSQDSDDETLVFNENLYSMPPSSYNLSTRSGTAKKSPSKANSPVIDPVVNCATPVPIKQRVAIVTPGKQAGEERGNPTDTSTSTSCDTCQDAPGGAGGGKPRPHNPLKNRSRGARTVGLGLGGEGDSSGEDDVGLAETLDKQCSLRGTTEDSSVNFDVNLASTGSQYGTLPTSLTSQPGDPGSGGSAGQRCRQRTLGLTVSNQDDLDQPVSPPPPRPAVHPGTPLSSRAGAGLPPATKRLFSTFRYCCHDCNRPMNTLEAYNAHMNGRAHKQKVASMAAPKRELGMTRRTQDGTQARQAAETDIINMEPRSYQLELFSKAMESDSIIFLPTGTGKTVIAAMVVSKMLHLNPTRPVLFLVDKVLLVLQQGQVIARELKNRQFLRLRLDHDSELVTREPKITRVCGDLQAVDGIPLYRHDVIVTTAAYCENLLEKGIIHWEDFSLVVLDEAHHCVGKHPYCNIMRDRHLELPADGRPKVLGLTASPAGKDTLDNTISMLKNLMKSLGHPRLAIVEGEGEKQELDQYQSKTKIEILKAEFSHEERQLCQELKEYIVKCYFKLAEVSNIKEEAPIFSKHSMDRACIDEIDHEGLKTFNMFLDTTKPQEKTKTKALFDYLRSHAQFTITMLMGIEGGAGVPFAVEEFKKLSSSGRDNEFDKAEQYGLPAKNLMAFVNKLDKVQDLEKKMQAKGMQQVTLFGQLRHVLFSDKYIKWGQEERPMALVLVRERVAAIQLSKGLQKLDDVQALGLRVCHAVGHGAKAGDGMKVQQQKRVLDGLREGRYQILVATSVVEEGVDIPECELVITLNPPDSVTALVQMRGRARKQGSNFIIICEGEDNKRKLEQLLLREKNMAEAVSAVAPDLSSMKRVI